MIPLRASEPVKVFPKTTLYLVLLLVFFELLSWLSPGTHAEFLQAWAFHPSENFLQFAKALWVHPNTFSSFVTWIFLWVFAPKLFEARKWWLCLLVAFAAAALAVASFYKIHPGSSVPVLLCSSWVGFLLGMFMKRDIWGNVSTFVFGPGFWGVYEVPSYVHLFFWSFYLLLGNFFLEPPLSDAPMLYWLPLSAFLMGFVFESLWGFYERLSKRNRLLK